VSVGQNGQPGAQGATGFTGFTGSTGSRGATGHTGRTGGSGYTGYTGSTGIRGIQGERGFPGSAAGMHSLLLYFQAVSFFFRHKSGNMQLIQTKFSIRGQVKGLQRSGNFWRFCPILGKMGAGTSLAELRFLCDNPDDLSATSQRPIFTKFGHEM